MQEMSLKNTCILTKILEQQMIEGRNNKIIISGMFRVLVEGEEKEIFTFMQERVTSIVLSHNPSDSFIETIITEKEIKEV